MSERIERRLRSPDKANRLGMRAGAFLKRNRAHNGEKGGVTGHLQAEIDGFLQGDRGDARQGADPQPVRAQARILGEPPVDGRGKGSGRRNRGNHRQDAPFGRELQGNRYGLL